MKKKVFSLFATFYFVSMLGICCSSEPEILIGRVSPWPPYCFKEDGRWCGISVDAYRALTDEAGAEFIMSVLPWSRGLQYMKTKPVMIASLTPTVKRSEDMYFFGPHYHEIMGVVLSVKNKNEKISSLDDLVVLSEKTGKQFIYQQDIYYSEEFNSRIESDKDFSEHFEKKVTNLENSFDMVADDMYLGFFDDKQSLRYFIKTKEYSDQLFVHDYKISQKDVYIGVSKTISDDMYKKLEKADKQLEKNEVYLKLREKWSSFY